MRVRACICFFNCCSLFLPWVARILRGFVGGCWVRRAWWAAHPERPLLEIAQYALGLVYVQRVFFVPMGRLSP